MKDLRELDKYRFKEGETQRYGRPLIDHERKYMGVFIVPSSAKVALRIIADAGQGWDHVSVSIEDRTPTWEEMDRIKRMFFKDKETAVQYHVPVNDHINIHPHCLHLWSPRTRFMPVPPKDRV
jgi:hypothetical protein